MTDSMEDTGTPRSRLSVLRQRVLRVRDWVRARNVNDDFLLFAAGAVLAFFWFPLAGGVISRHYAGYVAAGVSESEASLGAIAVQVVFLVLSGATVEMLRRDNSDRLTVVVASVAAGWAVVFAVLPSVAAGWSWLAVLLALAATLSLLNAGLVLLAAAVVLLPDWSRSRRETGGETN